MTAFDPPAFDLRRQSVRGGVVSLLAQVVKFILQLTAVITLARLVSPEDYGLFGIVVAVTGFLNLFRDLGLGLATIQNAEIHDRQLSAIYWVNIAAGCALALLTMASAPLIGWAYREPRLPAMILAMSMGYVVHGFVGLPHALLRRQLRFVTLAVIDVLAMAGGVVLGIVLALRGAGYWSLVVAYLTTSVISGLGFWLASRWRPGAPARLTEIRTLLSFGGRVTLIGLFGYLTRNLDSLLIGGYWGMRELGFYDKAYQILLLPILQISIPLGGVALPVLSRLQFDPARYRSYYSRVVLLVTALAMGLVAFVFVTTEKTVEVVLGAAWLPTVPMFRALAPAGFADTFFATMSWILLSLGQTRRMMRSVAVISIVAVLSFLVGLPWGALGVASAFSVSRVLLLVPMIIYCCVDAPLRWIDVLVAMARPAATALIAATGLFALMPLIHIEANALLDLSFDAMIFAALYLLAWLIIPGGMPIVREAVRLIPLLAPSGAARNDSP